MITPHPYVVQYIDSQLVVNEVTGHHEMLIICELCDGGFTLINMIEYCKGKVPHHVVLSMASDIAQGIAWMHDKGVSHRDLKVENILLHEQKFKLADFGSAEFDSNFLRWKRLPNDPSIKQRVI